MALDPSIILQAGRGVVPLESPLDAMGKALAVKQAMQQNQMQSMQLEDARALRGDIAAAQGNPEALKSALLKRGKVKEVHEMGTAALQEQRAQAEAQKAHLDAVNSLNGQQLQVYQSALDALDKDPTQAPAIHSFVLSKTTQNAKTLFPQLDTSRTDDPQAFQDVAQQKAWLQNKISQSMTMDQRLKVAAQKAEADYKAWQMQHGDTTAAETARHNKEMEKKPSGISIGLSGGPGGLTQDAKDLMVDQFRKTGTLPAVGQGKAGTQLRMDIINGAAAKDKAEGTVTDLAEAKKSFKTQQDAMKYFTTGQGASAMRQQETILHHAKVFEQIADALDNGNWQLANRLGAEVGAQFGDDKPTNLKIAANIFSAEVGKYLAGAQGSAEERAELAKLLPVFNSPSQFKGGLKTLSNLVEGQRKSWMRQRTAALSGKVTDEGGGNAPKVGSVVDGYVFLGGDPASPKSWKKK